MNILKYLHPYSPLLHRYYDKRQFKFDSNSSLSIKSSSDRSFLSDDDHSYVINNVDKYFLFFFEDVCSSLTNFVFPVNY